MPAPDKLLEAYQQAMGSHHHVSEFIANLNQLAPLLREYDPVKKTNGIKAFLQIHVVDHFAFEETVVFPALLALDTNVATRSLISELQYEHKTILLEVEKLHRLLQADDLGEFESAFRGFLGTLQRHAAKEDQLLYPLVQHHIRQS